jgi:hypothetical protein
MIAARPWLGWGIGSYSLYQSDFTPGAFRPEVVNLRGASLFEQAHSEYLQIAAETGLIGLGLHLAIVVSFWLFGLRALARMNHGPPKYVLIGCLGAVVAIGVDGLANPAWRYPEVSFFSWLAMGLGVAAVQTSVLRKESTRAAAAVKRSMRKSGRRLWQAGVCLFIAISVGRVAASFPLQGDALSTDCMLAASYTDIEACKLLPEGDVMIRFGECTDFRLYVTFTNDVPNLIYDVTDCPGTSIDVVGWSDEARCLEKVSPCRFCLREDSPASCQGKPIVVSGRYEAGGATCESSSRVIPSGVDVSREVGMRVTGTDFGRIFPPDNTLRTVTFSPANLGAIQAGTVVRLVSVQSDSGGFGTQPEIIILDDTMDAASPNIVVQLRAALNRQPLTGLGRSRRRLYTLTFELRRPDGATGTAVVYIDVNVVPRRRA